MTASRDGSIERRAGAYRLLEVPGPYALVQRAIGARAVHRALAERFLEPFPGMRVLDVGAGTGALHPWLGNCRYTALEPNSEYVERMREAFSGTDAVVVEGTTSAMADLEGPFDRILMVALLHHLDDATARAAFDDASSLLAPDGRVLTLDPCFHSGQSLIARRLAAMDRGANVRQVDEYATLATPAFDDVRTYLSTDLMRVPYSHAWLVAEHLHRIDRD